MQGADRKRGASAAYRVTAGQKSYRERLAGLQIRRQKKRKIGRHREEERWLTDGAGRAWGYSGVEWRTQAGDLLAGKQSVREEEEGREPVRK
jgi:hypothetical protein